ncbi:hypothetical protein ACX3O0_10120 [Homoserinimonas sp. A447]
MTDNSEPTTPIHDSVASTSSEAKMADARPVRPGTVIWGVIMVAIAAMYFATAQVDLDEVSGWVILAWGILALGAVLVVGGLIAALTRRNP